MFPTDPSYHAYLHHVDLALVECMAEHRMSVQQIEWMVVEMNRKLYRSQMWYQNSSQYLISVVHSIFGPS